MIELVDQLHDCQVCSVAQNYCRNHVLIQRAAARIEELEAALRAIDARCTKLRNGTDDWFELVEFQQVARQVLDKQEDK